MCVRCTQARRICGNNSYIGYSVMAPPVDFILLLERLVPARERIAVHTCRDVRGINARK